MQLRVHRKDGTTFGSGYLVAPALVLTAGHVVKEVAESDDVSVTVCRPDGGEDQFPATVVWLRIDHRTDAALVRVQLSPSYRGEVHWAAPESLADTHIWPPQRWGVVIGNRPHEVAIAGFPRMEKDAATDKRLDGRISGRLMPGIGGLAGRYEVVSNDATRAVTTPQGSTGWSGMSGAAVVAESPQGGLLCGVVWADAIGGGGKGTRLTATQASVLFEDPDFTRIIAKYGKWPPVLEAVEPSALLEPAARLRDPLSPTMLLRADAEAVRFRGREEELQELGDWCEKHAAPFAVRVVTGPGGQGKSRLARRLSDLLHAKGWVTGHLRGELRDLDQGQLDSLETALPFLLVIDYADARPLLVRRVIDRLRGCRHRTRVLLLARADGRWRTDGLTASHADEILARAPVFPLEPLAPEEGPTEDRVALYDDALADLSELLETVPELPGRPPAGWPALVGVLRAPRDLDDPVYESVLTVQMAALVALLQSGSTPVEAAGEEPYEATLLRHEQRYWIRSAQRLGPTDNTDVQRAVAVATMCGASDPAEAVAVIGALPEIPADRTNGVAAWLRTLYPPGPGTYWGGIQPDRVGEYHATRVLLDFEQPLPLTALLRHCSAEQQVRLFTVLVRAAGAIHEAERLAGIERALLDAVESVDLGADTLSRLSLTTTLSLGRMNGLELLLAEKNVSARRRLAQDGSASAQADLASALSGLNYALGQAGRREEALRVGQERLSIWEELDPGDPHRDGQYAHALISLSTDLRALGRHDEAIRQLWRGIDWLEQLAPTDPDVRSTLAFNLQFLADMLRNAGRLDEAADALHRAVEVTAELSDSDPRELFNLTLQRSNLITLLMGAGRVSEARRIAADLVEAGRAAARQDPQHHEWVLIGALANLAVLHQHLGETAEACSAMEESLALAERQRQLGLDSGMTNYGIVVNSLQLCLWQSDDAPGPDFFQGLRRALDTWHRLDYAPFEEAPSADLLSRAANVLIGAGLWQAALEPALAALLHAYRLVCQDPDAHVGTYIRGIGTMEKIQPHVREEWFHATPELEALCEQLVQLREAAEESAIQAHTSALTSSTGLGDRRREGRELKNLGAALHAVRRFDDAIDVSNQALVIFRDLGDRHGEGQALNNLGLALRAVGRFGEAIEAHTRDLVICRDLGDRHGEGQALNNLGDTLQEVGSFDDAIHILTQAATICHDLGDRHGEGQALNNLGLALRAVGRFGEAIEAHTRDLVICRDLGDRHGEGQALNNLGLALQEVGRFGEAIDAYTGDLVICRDLGDRHGEGKTLNNLGIVLRDVGRFEEAVDAHTRAAAIFAAFGDRDSEGVARRNVAIAVAAAERAGSWWGRVRGRGRRL
ncbi:tetratricopeptide repeat protein [Kitasatospora sp. NPDC050543]|uniref:tetratricopeptide repeat protein n=1 Tax=Kitasatospora sp. NPDC050543 TaxID=3364054 RepID=UPI0037AD673A